MAKDAGEAEGADMLEANGAASPGEDPKQPGEPARPQCLATDINLESIQIWLLLRSHLPDLEQNVLCGQTLA